MCVCTRVCIARAHTEQRKSSQLCILTLIGQLNPFADKWNLSETIVRVYILNSRLACTEATLCRALQCAFWVCNQAWMHIQGKAWMSVPHQQNLIAWNSKHVTLWKMLKHSSQKLYEAVWRKHSHAMSHPVTKNRKAFLQRIKISGIHSTAKLFVNRVRMFCVMLQRCVTE